jgi:predicted hotdog family 3-hydroxylacyl-ACP dehydratase
MNDFASLLPHAGTAVMIQELVHWDEHDIQVRTLSHRSADNPLRFEGRLASVHLAEYGAQSMAAHGALRARAAGGTPVSALLVSVRQFAATRNFVDDLAGPLEIRAHELFGSPTGWQYEFEVWHEGERIAHGRVAALAFALPEDQAAAGSRGPG